MKTKQAIQHLIKSEAFKEKAKQRNSEGAKYRMFLKRFNDGELSDGNAIEMLLAHGYSLDIKGRKVQ
jgi:hypothetical protein